MCNEPGRAHLRNLDLVLMYGGAVYVLLVRRGPLNDSLDENNRFSRYAFRPANHSLRDLVCFLCQDTLYGRELMPENQEHDLRPYIRISTSYSGNLTRSKLTKRPNMVYTRAEGDLVSLIHVRDVAELIVFTL